MLERTLIRLAESSPPRLLVVIDTEEEFDWERDFDRANTSVTAMRHLGRAQRIFDERGVIPTYVVDFPVASQDEGLAPLAEIHADGRATVGAHLHPWVTPPHEEVVDRRNSFPGNLPRRLEAAKLARLADELATRLGERPAVYTAGRYGLGPNTAAILAEQGFEVDLSASPPYDYRGEGGPDYGGFGCEPYWFGDGSLLGVPSTGAYVGWAGAAAPPLYAAAAAAPEWSRLPGVLARSGAIERLRLSPEGFAGADLERLTRHLLRRGLRVFNLSFHSPSLEPGWTPYVRSASDLGRFLDRLRRYLDLFLGELGGAAVTPLELKRRLAAAPDGGGRR